MFVALVAGISLISMAPEPQTASKASAAEGNSRALEPFERDWLLMDWALRRFDRDKDASLSLAEAQVAAAALKDMADGDGDGRVTTYEFDRAREFILARY